MVMFVKVTASAESRPLPSQLSVALFPSLQCTESTAGVTLRVTVAQEQLLHLVLPESPVHCDSHVLCSTGSALLPSLE